MFYHGTRPEDAASIEDTGLRTNHGGWLYLTPRLEEARCYGGAVFEVRVPPWVRLTAFDGHEDWEVLCWSPLPPAFLRRIE